MLMGLLLIIEMFFNVSFNTQTIYYYFEREPHRELIL
jgi:hypothetical protein